MMAVSMAMTAGSGYYVVTELQNRQATVNVPLQQVKRPVPPPVKPAPLAQAPAAALTPTPTATTLPAPAPQEKSKETQAKRTILFSLTAPNAKKVFVVGDFNDWFREPMKRKGHGPWTAAIKLEPGEHSYMFVVDGRKIRDPKIKKVSDDGKSVVSVKPLAKK
jgi:hypothetical protein